MTSCSAPPVPHPPVRLDAPERARSAFVALFAEPPALVARAPGRVNLIGEHTDYNDGFVLPMALPHSTGFAVRRRRDRMVVLESEGYGTTRIDLDALAPGDRVVGWGLHVAGTLWALAVSGLTVMGFEGTVATDVPVGAGLSSSAALEVATAAVAFELAGLAFDPIAAALAGQRAEGEFFGLPSGIMDQLVSAAAVAGSTLLIDCRSLVTVTVPVPDSATVVILDTMSRRELADSDYGARRRDCEAASAALGVDALRDATLEMVDAAADRLGPRMVHRAHHVIAENARTQQAAVALVDRDIVAFGSAMNDSHASLRDLYEVSGPELDIMVDIAQHSPGALGARMTGGGFAGAAVALVAVDEADAFVAHVSAAYAARTGVAPRLYVVRPGPGAGLV